MDDSVKKSKKMVDIVNDGSQVSQPVSVPAPKPKRPKTMLIVLIVLSVLLVASVVVGYVIYSRYQDVKDDPRSAITQKNQEETARVLEGLKRRLFIGEQEAPTVARVEDPEKLKKSNAEFYKDIQKGDYLVIYPKRAIIYRESIDQIINVAPIINTSELRSQTETSTTPTTE